MTSSLKDFLDLMKTQFGDKTREEMEEMLKSGMSMEQVRFFWLLYFHICFYHNVNGAGEGFL